MAMPVYPQTTKTSISSKTLYGLLGARKFFADYISGAKANRPGLNSAMEMARAGDTLVIWRLDRLGRSLKDLIELTEALRERSIGLHSLQESIDTHRAAAS